VARCHEVVRRGEGNFLNSRVKTAIFIAKKIVAARHRDRGGLNRPPGADDVKLRGARKFSRVFKKHT